MQAKNNKQVFDIVIYLMGCALNEIAPSEEYLEGADLVKVSSFAYHHSVGALVTSALEKISKAPTKALEKKNLAIRKSILFNAERAKISQALEESNIKHIPNLKGAFLQEFYPSIGLRQMSDNDMLIDIQHRDKVRDIMVSFGYNVVHYDKGNHDVYTKEPVYNFEMHVSLFSDGYNEAFARDFLNDFYNYYNNFLDKAAKDDDAIFRHHLSNEDMYVYMKAHEYKHYTLGGTGLRSFADTFVFLDAKKSELDFEYINQQLEQLNLVDYTKKTEEISKLIFSKSTVQNPPDSFLQICDEEQKEILSYTAASGTYGTKKHIVDNAIKHYEKSTSTRLGARLKYFWDRLFPPMSFYQKHVPICYKYKILIPFYTLKRVLSACFLRPRNTFKILKNMFGKGK